MVHIQHGQLLRDYGSDDPKGSCHRFEMIFYVIYEDEDEMGEGIMNELIDFMLD